MAAIGERVYIDGYSYFQLYADEGTPNLNNSTSPVRAYLNLVVPQGGWVGSSGITVGINGTQKDLGYKDYYGGTHTLITVDIDAPHYPDGNETLWLSWWFNGYIGNWTGEGTLVLTKIFPVLNSGSDFTDRTNPILDITAYNTYDLRVKLEVEGQTIAARNLSTKNSTVYTFNLTDEERLSFNNLMTGDVLVVRENVSALRNGSEISWYYKDYRMFKTGGKTRIRVNGQWKDATPYVRVNGQWKEAKPYIRINNQWKEGI